MAATEDSTGADGAPVLALVADLMFASRIAGAGRAAGVPVETVQSEARLWARADALRPRCVMVDLAVRAGDPIGVIERLKGSGAYAGVPVVAFGAHVDRDALSAARDAGADRVLARSAFVRELPSLLRVGGGHGGEASG